MSARESSSDLYREYQKQRKILQVPHPAEYCVTNSVLYVILEFTAFFNSTSWRNRSGCVRSIDNSCWRWKRTNID